MKSSYQGKFNFVKYLENVIDAETILYTGKVKSVRGLEIESEGPHSVIGEMCTIKLGDGSLLQAEVVGLQDKIVKLAAFGDTKGIEVGCEVIASGHTLQVPVGMSLLGRTIDATGRACDGLGEISPEKYYPAINVAPDPMKKLPVNKRIITGVRAIDGLLTIGKGQRIGIFAGSGVGKSTLLSMIARSSNADINVIGLIGERGREVLDFIKRALNLQQVPPTAVLNGIAFFMTIFAMWPTFTKIYDNAYKPLADGNISIERAFTEAETPIRNFMFSQMSSDSGKKYISMFMGVAKLEQPKNTSDVPTYILIPAYILNELTIAFKIGIILYIPFLIIDMVCASILMAMGMIMLPPVQISMPFKLMIFILVDGWGLLTQQLFNSIL